MASAPLRDDLHKDFKQKCVSNDRKMKKVTSELVQMYINGEVEVFNDQ